MTSDNKNYIVTRDRGHNVGKRTREHRVATKDREHIEREMYISETGQKVGALGSDPRQGAHTEHTERAHRESTVQ